VTAVAGAIKVGSMADFKNTTLTGVPKSAKPYYVKVAIKNLSSKSIGGDNNPADALGAVTTGGLDSDLIIGGFFPPCPDADLPKPFKGGTTFNTCETFMEKAKVAQIGYNGSLATLNSPVLWGS
jgi:hypothetical protein